LLLAQIEPYLFSKRLIETYKNTDIDGMSDENSSSVKNPRTIFDLSKNYFDVQHIDRPYIRKARSSWKLVDWVVQYSGLTTPSSRLVAATIASYYSKDKGYAFPSAPYVCLKANVSRATFTRAVKEMKLSGEWLVLPIKIQKEKKEISNRYIPLAPVRGDRYKVPSSEQVKTFNSPTKLYAVEEFKVWNSTVRADWLRSNYSFVDVVKEISLAISLDAQVNKSNSYHRQGEHSYRLIDYLELKEPNQQKKLYDAWMLNLAAKYNLTREKL
jgi:hypothetical protein